MRSDSEADTLQPQVSLNNPDASKTLKAATEMSEAEKVALIQLQAAQITAEASYKSRIRSAQIFCVAIVLASVLGCLVLVWGFAGTFSRAVDTAQSAVDTSREVASRAVDTSGEVAQTLSRAVDISGEVAQT